MIEHLILNDPLGVFIFDNAIQPASWMINCVFYIQRIMTLAILQGYNLRFNQFCVINLEAFRISKNYVIFFRQQSIYIF